MENTWLPGVAPLIPSSFPSLSTKNFCPPQLLHKEALIFHCVANETVSQCHQCMREMF